MAKERLRQAGLPTPDWVGGRLIKPRPVVAVRGATTGRGFISDAPLFLHLLRGSSKGLGARLHWHGRRCGDGERCPAELGERLRQRTARSGCPCFAERFIDGREFAVTLLAGPHGPDVHPPYEIEFHGFALRQARIVAIEQSGRPIPSSIITRPAASISTLPTRRFWTSSAGWPSSAGPCSGFAVGLGSIFGSMRPGSRRSWRQRQPVLSPDAGFAAALQQASIPLDIAIRRILEDSM